MGVWNELLVGLGSHKDTEVSTCLVVVFRLESRDPFLWPISFISFSSALVNLGLLLPPLISSSARKNMVSIHATYGALLLGGLFASMLSGLVVLQAIIYFKTYESDRKRIKVLVVLIFILDILHTALVWVALWDYLIGHFRDDTHIHDIDWAISVCRLRHHYLVEN